jgi:hypothetical protein
MIVQNVTEVKREAALDTIRGFLLRYWKQKVTRDFNAWWEDQRVQAEKVGSLPDLLKISGGRFAWVVVGMGRQFCPVLLEVTEEVPDRNA